MSKTVVVLALVVAFVAVALSVSRPVPVATPEPTPTPSPVEVQVNAVTDGGVGLGPTVWRDQAGTIIAVANVVRPYNFETVACSLTVDGQLVEATGSDGNPAVCVWVRGGVS